MAKKKSKRPRIYRDSHRALRHEEVREEAPEDDRERDEVTG